MIGKLATNGESAGFSSFVVSIGGMSISCMIIDSFRTRRADTAKVDTERKKDNAPP